MADYLLAQQILAAASADRLNMSDLFVLQIVTLCRRDCMSVLLLSCLLRPNLVVSFSLTCTMLGRHSCLAGHGNMQFAPRHCVLKHFTRSNSCNFRPLQALCHQSGTLKGMTIRQTSLNLQVKCCAYAWGCTADRASYLPNFAAVVDATTRPYSCRVKKHRALSILSISPCISESDSASKRRQVSWQGCNRARPKCSAHSEQNSNGCACWNVICIQPECVGHEACGTFWSVLPASLKLLVLICAFALLYRALTLRGTDIVPWHPYRCSGEASSC